MVTRHSAIVGLPENEPGQSSSGYPAIERHTVVDLPHITRYERLPQPEGRKPA